MARSVGYEEDWVTYIPAAYDNREDTEPVTVELHPLLGEEHRAYMRGAVTAKESDAEDRAEKSLRRIFTDRVRNVRNYSVRGKPIITGTELLKLGEDGIVNEILVALINMSTLGAGAVGKSSLRSASSPAVTAQPEVGAAQSVAEATRASSQMKTSDVSATAMASPTPASIAHGPANYVAPGLS